MIEPAEIIVGVTPEALAKAKEESHYLDTENRGKKTLDGGPDKNVKGSLAQWAVDETLNDWGIEHVFKKPYVKEQYGDQYDLKVDGEVWDVKCRGWYEYDTFAMTMREMKSSKKPDYYIMTTMDKVFKKVYILGAISYKDMWEKLEPPPNARWKFPPAGMIHKRHFTPFKEFVFKI